MADEGLGARAARRKAQFLEVAAKRVIEGGLRGRFPEITVDSLLEELPDDVTRGAFTNIWKRKEDFDSDLVRYLTDHRRFPQARTLSKNVLPLAESGAPLSQLIKMGAFHTLEAVVSSQEWRLIVAFLSMVDDPAIGPIVREQLSESDRTFEEQSAQLYRLLLLAHHRRMRPGLDVLDLATALGATITGLGMRRLIDPARVPMKMTWEGESDWSLAGITAQAIIEHFTEPVPEASENSQR